MTLTKQEGGRGLVLKLTWANVAAAVAFFVVVAPAIFFTGAFSTRLTAVERAQVDHEIGGPHPEAVVAIGRNTAELRVFKAEVLGTLKSIDRRLAELARNHDGRNDP